MNKKIDELLHQLRAAIQDALADSWDVAIAMTELEQLGRCPSLFVDVTLADPLLRPKSEQGIFGEGLVLSDYDQQFLRAIKVAGPV